MRTVDLFPQGRDNHRVMSDEDTNIEVLPRKQPRARKKREHELLLAEIRQHVDIPDDYHPVVSMAIIANNPRLPLNLQLKAHAEVAQYVTRKLKPTDAPSENESGPPALMLTLRTKPSEQ